MQFSVPQFTEVEDKIIGPLTLKQFLILLVGSGVIVLVYKLIGNFIIFLILSLPIAGVTVFVAFGQIQGKSMGDLVVAALGFFSEPTSFIFHKQPQAISPVVRKKPEGNGSDAIPALSQEEKLSRLKNLTYILDQDIKAEKELFEEKYVHLKK